MFPLTVEIFGNGKPLILLHGWGWHSGVWLPILPKLSAYYQIYLIDLPGFGKNKSLPTHYSFEEIVPYILKVTPPKAAWLGWSMGGLFAAWIAIHFPERVTQLITIASSPKFVRDNDWSGLELSTLENFSGLLTFDPEKTLEDFLELQLRGSANKNNLFAELQKIIKTNPSSKEALLAGLQLLKDTDLRRDIVKIECPNLHIFGDRDTIVPVRTVDSLLPLYRNGRFEIINRTGHMPFLSHQDEMVDLLGQFLDE